MTQHTRRKTQKAKTTHNPKTEKATRKNNKTSKTENQQYKIKKPKRM